MFRHGKPTTESPIFRDRRAKPRREDLRKHQMRPTIEAKQLRAAEAQRQVYIFRFWEITVDRRMVRHAIRRRAKLDTVPPGQTL